MAKQYGLIVPNKQVKAKAPPIFSVSKNVFGDDSDSEDDGRNIPKLAVTSGAKIKRQALAAQEKALEEDPTVYQYDELYDDMEDKKKQIKSSAKSEEKKPKYIERLLLTSEKRKRENERRIERQVQKEREEEGDKFADKESFVTSSYKKKLEEMKLDEEKEMRENYLEEIGDVTKQADLGGFYRHLYGLRLGNDNPKIPAEKGKDTQQPAGSSKIITETKSSSEDKSDDSDSEKKSVIKKNVKKSKDKRSYRKRKLTEETKDKDGSDSDDAEVTKKNLESIKSNKKAKASQPQANIDADSDFSIDDSSSDEGESSDHSENKSEKPKAIEQTSTEQNVFKKPDDVKIATPTENIDKKSEKVEKKTNKVVEVKETKPKIDIWKKRTVGEVFDQALERYYQRKASRGY